MTALARPFIWAHDGYCEIIIFLIIPEKLDLGDFVMTKHPDFGSSQLGIAKKICIFLLGIGRKTPEYNV